MLWESLVTEGHVRAARVRRMQPWVIVLGLLLIWGGIWIARRGPDVRPPTSFISILQERAAKLQQRAQAAVDSLPQLNLSPAAVRSLPPQSELGELVAAIRQSLSADDELPATDVDFKEMKPEEFWRGEWPSEQVAYIEDDDTYVFGANVFVGSPAYPQPVRWIGVMKKAEKDWQYVTLGGNRLVGINELPSSYAGQIALSLTPFLPDEKT